MDVRKSETIRYSRDYFVTSVKRDASHRESFKHLEELKLKGFYLLISFDTSTTTFVKSYVDIYFL